jgi:hypothetical protein
MRNKLYILFLMPFLVLTGCFKPTTDTEWNEIKDKSDFSLFFQYAIATDNTEFLNSCNDSLTKYKPSRDCEILRYYNYYNTYQDSTYYHNFFIENQCDVNIDYYYRDILVIEINENDSLRIIHQGEELKSWKSSLISFFDTTSTSEYLPRYDLIEYNNEKYMQRHVGVFIYNQMYPDSLPNKSSWNKLIQVTKEVLNTIDKIKNNKAEKIFGVKLSELNNEKRKFISDLIPTFLNIYFYLSEPPSIPPPPPLTSKEIDDILFEN